MNEMAASLDKALARSDQQIAVACSILNGSERGRKVLANLASLFTSGASGLDQQGMDAMVALVREFAAGRRSFIDEIKQG